MGPERIPNPPDDIHPPEDWPHFRIYKAVKEAIYSLPSRFESPLQISGVLATDLFAFNSSLGATIEQQVVNSLNRLRPVWDPRQEYQLYEFERQPQTFPDVVLKTAAPGGEPNIILGIELKGWYVLAKEKEPSFRYKVTAEVCAPADLLVVVPWALTNVISGSPIVFEPFIMSAKSAALHRNWYWSHKRQGHPDRAINISDVRQNYPNKSDRISDEAARDSGGNFGRIARTGVMDKYVKELFSEKLSGIPLFAWQQFLSIFTEGVTSEHINLALERIERSIIHNVENAELTRSISNKFREIAAILDPE